MDGGSTDCTQKVVKNYLDKVEFFISEKDLGQSNAINKGLDLAKGEIVGWINSDDTLLPGTFSTIIKEFVLNPNLGFVYGNINIIDLNDKIIGKLIGKTCVVPEIIWKLDVPIPQQGSFWRRDLMVNNSVRLNENFHFVLDRDVFIRSLLLMEVKYINFMLGNFRHHEASKSISQIARWIDEIPILYEGIILDFSENKLNSLHILRIKAMVDIYCSIELFKMRMYKKSLNYLFRSILKNPIVLFRCGFIRKAFNYLLVK
jgi:glycosyltransferase involved in cell wall biosynthesis